MNRAKCNEGKQEKTDNDNNATSKRNTGNQQQLPCQGTLDRGQKRRVKQGSMMQERGPALPQRPGA